MVHIQHVVSRNERLAFLEDYFALVFDVILNGTWTESLCQKRKTGIKYYGDTPLHSSNAFYLHVSEHLTNALMHWGALIISILHRVTETQKQTASFMISQQICSRAKNKNSWLLVPCLMHSIILSLLMDFRVLELLWKQRAV